MSSVKKLLVIAMAAGFYGHLRDPGDKFEIPGDEEPGKWMRVLDDDGQIVKPAKAGKDTKPEVLPTAAAAVNTAPFTPPEAVYTVVHVPVGNFAVVDASGEKVGEVFPAVKGAAGQAKIAAQQEADRLNAELASGKAGNAEEDNGASDLPDA